MTCLEFKPEEPIELTELVSSYLHTATTLQLIEIFEAMPYNDMARIHDLLDTRITEGTWVS